MPFFFFETQGPQGPQGASAFDIAVANGFGGTEQEWLVSLQGATGPQGLPGAPSYEHTQVQPSDTWTVVHALNFRPNINVVDSTGEVLYCSITHVDKIMAIIRFNVPVSGVATCS